MANKYTHGHHPSVLRSHTWRTVANSANYVVPFFTRGASVLDVGCGPGTITIEMAERVAPGRVVGIDASSDVIAKAREGVGDRSNVSFEVANIAALNFPDDTFDIVHAHQVLQHLDDPVAALREMRRLVKRNGVVTVRDADYGAMCWHPEDPLMDRWVDVYSTVARTNRAEPDAGRRLRAWAHEAGFTGIDTSVDTWCFTSPDDCAWWGGLWADRVQTSSFGFQAESSGLVTRDELNEIAEAWRRWSTHPDAFFSVPNTQLICRG